MAKAVKSATERDASGDAHSRTAKVVRWREPPVPLNEIRAIFKAKGSTPDSEAEAYELIETYLRRQLVASGVKISPEIVSEISSRAINYVTGTAGLLPLIDEGAISAEFAQVVEGFAESELKDWMYGVRYHHAERVEINDQDDVKYSGLVSYFITSLQARLESLGADHGNAERTAKDIFRSIRVSAGPNIDLKDKAQVDLYVDLIAATTLALGGTAKGNFNLVSSPEPGGVAGPKWDPKMKAEFGTAEAFLQHHYGPRLGIDGDLDQATLRKIDGPLMDALNVEFRGERRAELRDLLPTKTQRLDQKLRAALGHVPKGEERRRALTSLSRGHKIGVRRSLR